MLIYFPFLNLNEWEVIYWDIKLFRNYESDRKLRVAACSSTSWASVRKTWDSELCTAVSGAAQPEAEASSELGATATGLSSLVWMLWFRQQAAHKFFPCSLWFGPVSQWATNSFLPKTTPPICPSQTAVECWTPFS